MMKVRLLFFFLLSLIASPPTINAVFHVTAGCSKGNPHNRIRNSYDTSYYIHYGPREFAVNGTSIFISSFNLCNEKTFMTRKVADKVVITDRMDAGRGSCHIADLYSRLMHAGALALVVSEVVPVGLLSYSHHNVLQCKHSSASMPLVSIYQAPGKACRDEWDGSEVEISSPHDDSFQRLFVSYRWLILMRILLPLFALITSLIAISVIHIRRKKKSEIGIVDFICFIEAPCNIIIGILLALGHFGPMMLPINIHLQFTTLLMGASLITSVALALFLRGGAKFVQSLQPQQSVLVEHKFSLCFGSICLLLADVLWIICVGIKTKNNRAVDSMDLTFVFVGSTLFVIICQGLVCVYVFSQMYFFRNILKVFLKTGSDISPIRLKSIKIINRILIWIKRSGALMAISTLIQVTVIVLFVTHYFTGLENQDSYYFVIVFVVSTCRIGIAFTKIMATCSNDIAFRQLLVYLFRKRKVKKVASMSYNFTNGDMTQQEQRQQQSHPVAGSHQDSQKRERIMVSSSSFQHNANQQSNFFNQLLSGMDLEPSPSQQHVSLYPSLMDSMSVTFSSQALSSITMSDYQKQRLFNSQGGGGGHSFSSNVEPSSVEQNVSTSTTLGSHIHHSQANQLSSDNGNSLVDALELMHRQSVSERTSAVVGSSASHQQTNTAAAAATTTAMTNTRLSPLTSANGTSIASTVVAPCNPSLHASNPPSGEPRIKVHSSKVVPL